MGKHPSIIKVPEIRELPDGGSITRRWYAGGQAASASNTVQYVKKVYPRADGKTYTCHTDWDKQTFTVSVVDP